MRNQLAVTRNGQGKKPSFVPKVDFIFAIVFPSMQLYFRDCFSVIYLVLMHFCDTFLWWKSFVIFCLSLFLVPSRGKAIWFPFFHFWRIGPVLCRKMERRRSMKEKMDGELFLSRQSQHFPSIDKMFKVLLPVFTVNWCVNNYVSLHGKGISLRNESTKFF